VNRYWSRGKGVTVNYTALAASPLQFPLFRADGEDRRWLAVVVVVVVVAADRRRRVCAATRCGRLPGGPGDPISVDGETGRVILHVEGREEADYARRVRGYRVAVEEIRARPSPAVTLDGVEMVLEANVDREEDIDAAIARGAAGIGLLRTEILYLGEGRHVTEGYLEAVFRRVATRMGDRPVNVRILDLAPDKVLPLSGDVPLAGAGVAEGGVHYALAHPDILRPQLRAILRAADEGNLRILLPGVIGVTEIEAFRSVMETVADDLRRERGRAPRRVPLGAMIETLPALFMFKDIAERVDFLSLGPTICCVTSSGENAGE
jgi:phosphoenolpyruvate-protein kinase (PTS system EI component)